MRISVVIPTYKPQDYIWECLDSLYRQTLDKSMYELVLVLNGCDEPWRGRIEEWIALHTDLNINFVQTDTPGVSNARNIGLNNAAGKYITFIDDDDYVSAQYLEGLLNQTLIDRSAVILSNTISFFDDNGSFDESYSLRKTFYRLKNRHSSITLFQARSFFNGPCRKLLPSDFLKGNYFDTRFKNGEDSLYMYKISKNFKRILLAPEDCVYYRRFRAASAYTRKKTNTSVIKNQLKYACAILNIYIREPLRYSFLFTSSRILAGVKTVYLQLTK